MTMKKSKFFSTLALVFSGAFLVCFAIFCGGADKPGDGDHPSPSPICGANAQPAGSGCICDSGYRGNPPTDPCTPITPITPIPTPTLPTDSSLAQHMLKIQSLINNLEPVSEADKISLGLIESNQFKNAYSGLEQKDSQKSQKITDAIIANFVNAVTVFNDFVDNNDKIKCTDAEMTDIWSDEKFPPCKKITWLGYNNLGELYKLFSNPNENINKIRLALFFGNAWNESGGNQGLFNYCMQLKPSDAYPYSACVNKNETINDAEKAQPFYYCNGNNCQFIGAGIIQISYITNYTNIANILNQMKDKDLTGNALDGINNLLGSINPPFCNSPDGKTSPTKCLKAIVQDSRLPPEQNTQYECSANSIVREPYQICAHPLLAMLTSLIYESAQAERALKENSYHSSIEFCSVNQGGYTYPFSDEIKNKITEVSNSGSCDGLEGGGGRWEGFIKILKLFYPEINFNAGAWSIPIDEGRCYQKPNDANYAKMENC